VKKKILILGAYGYLGKILSAYLRTKYNVLRQSRNKKSKIVINKFNTKNILKVLQENKPDFIINLIAITNLDFCEKNKTVTKRINTDIVYNIREAIKIYNEDSNCHLIHISSDQVYSGVGPHKENKIRPINYYGKSKFKGEIIGKKVNSTILRVNFVGKNRRGKKSLSDWIVHSLRQKKEIIIFKDVYFNPLHTSELCKKIETVIRKKITGTFNLGAKNSISKANFALNLCKKLNLDKGLMKVGKITDSNLYAKRSNDTRMNVKKFEKQFITSLGSIQKQILLTVNEYK